MVPERMKLGGPSKGRGDNARGGRMTLTALLARMDIVTAEGENCRFCKHVMSKPLLTQWP